MERIVRVVQHSTRLAVLATPHGQCVLLYKRPSGRPDSLAADRFVHIVCTNAHTQPHLHTHTHQKSRAKETNLNRSAIWYLCGWLGRRTAADRLHLRRAAARSFRCLSRAQIRRLLAYAERKWTVHTAADRTFHINRIASLTDLHTERSPVRSLHRNPPSDFECDLHTAVSGTIHTTIRTPSNPWSDPHRHRAAELPIEIQ